MIEKLGCDGSVCSGPLKWIEAIGAFSIQAASVCHGVRLLSFITPGMICTYACNAFPMLGTMYVVALGSAGPFDSPGGDGQGFGSIDLFDTSLSLSFSFGSHCECYCLLHRNRHGSSTRSRKRSSQPTRLNGKLRAWRGV